MPGCKVLGLAVGVIAGLLLSALAVCMSRIFSLSLLATVRGGTSFLCPKRQRNEAKKTLSNHATLSVHSVQFPFIGTPKARCSPERRMFEPLLLANSYTHTLRPVRSRASTIAKEPTRPYAYVRLRFFGGSAARSVPLSRRTIRPGGGIFKASLLQVDRVARTLFSRLRPYVFLRPGFQVGCRSGSICELIF